MSVSKFAALAAVLMSAAAPHSFAQSPPLPAAPQVNVWSDPLKVLQFQWPSVSGATHYLLQHKPNASSPFATYGNPILAPRTRAALTIPVHALDWANARYKVSACNAAGCQDSTDISVEDLMLTSIGYVKASNPDRFDGFGGYAQLSQDGNTLVVSSHEDSNATGVNGNQSNNDSEDSGAVYVFRRIGLVWRQEAYLKPNVNSRQQYFGIGYPLGFRALSVTADGSLIAVGAPGEYVNGVEFGGAVYLFARAADGTWSQTEKFTLPAPVVYDFFGVSADLSSDGLYLKVTSYAQDRRMQRDYIFRHGAAGWFQYAVHAPDPGDILCSSQMSGNANAIVSICHGELNGSQRLRVRRGLGTWEPVQDIPLPSTFSQIPAVSGNGARIALYVVNAAGQREVRVYGWTGSAYVQETALESPGGTATDYPSFGQGLALNRNGTVLAVGDYSNALSGPGVSAPPPTSVLALREGAAFVYQRGTGSPGWTLSKVVKSPNFSGSFGRDVSLSGNGLTLAVGAPGERSGSRGIDGDQTNTSRPGSGAVYLY
jgi:hypothetical protein